MTSKTSSEIREQGTNSWDPPDSVGAGLLRRSGPFATSPAAGEADQTSNGACEGDNLGHLYRWGDPSSRRPRVCILGGGFGGLYTALKLESFGWTADKRPQVLLVDQSERFVFKPFLYELLSKEVDQWEIAPRFSELLGRSSTRYLQGKVKIVAPCEDATGRSLGGTVVLENGTRIQYDWLLLGLGAETRMDLVPGAREHALPFANLEDALEVDDRLLSLERERSGAGDPDLNVVIVGAGYSGVELAATLAQRLGKHGKVQVVDTASTICPSASSGNREAALRVLSSRNVDLVLGYSVAGISRAADNGGPIVLDLKAVHQQEGGDRELHADMVLWTVGTRAMVPAGEVDGVLAFPVNGRGQADTDSTLRVKGYARVFAIGDSAGGPDSSGKVLPATAQVAFQQVKCAAFNLWAAINGKPLRQFKYKHLGEMMTLGKYHGVVTVNIAGGFTLDGVAGHSARKLAYLFRLPTSGHRLKVALSWVVKTTVDSISFAQDTVASVLNPALGRTQLVCVQGGRFHLLCSRHRRDQFARP